MTSPPSTLYMTAVEAVSFLSYGAFLTLDDIVAASLAAVVETGSVKTVGVPRNLGWEGAQRRLFVAHVEGLLTLYGRKAPRLGANPVADTAPMPKEFFAGDAVLGLSAGRRGACGRPAP
jgi:hypothetical protein